MNFSVTLTNADNIKLGIRNIGHALEDVTIEDIEKRMELAAKMSVPYRGANIYDVEPTPNYERTGNLGRSVEVFRRGMSIVIHAAAYRRGREYTTYVIGDRNGNGQAWMHVGRWTPMREAVDTHLDLLIEEVDQDIQKVIDQSLP